MSPLVTAGCRKLSLRNWFRWLAPFATLVLLAVGPSTCHALILKGEGNSPLDDPGWPVGAAAVFNTRARVGWWEGPPFGGGQWHAECRGDAAALNDVLVNFAKIDAPMKLLIVHDGVGSGFWDKLDWVFVVWQSANFQRQAALPPRIRQPGVDYQQGPVPQLDVYAGGRVKWADVKLPEGIEVVDERLEAHGFAVTDGTVLEGTVVDLASDEPLAARVHLEGIEPQPSTVTDQSGRWVLKNVPAGGFRVVVEAEGCVSRIIGYGQSDGEPKWHEFRGGLSRPGPVSGRVTDEEDRPLAGVLVRLDDMVVAAGGLYETPAGLQFETDEAGRFESFDVPIGTASVRVFKDGYCRPGLGLPVTTPALNLKLTMMQSAEVQVAVDFSQTTRPEGYHVEFSPEQGRRAGSWSGSGSIDASGVILFKNVPPGRYVIFGRPNPGSADEQTEPITVEVVGGKTTKIVIKAK